jgi:cytochrome c553
MKRYGCAWLLAMGMIGQGTAFAQDAPPPRSTLTCIGCHGTHGEGNAQLKAPRIAGQPAFYLERQLDAYAQGQRQNDVMSPVARQLDAQQRREAASYFATLVAPPSPRPAPAPPQVKRARTLAEHGDEARQIQACQNCHGPDGHGQGGVRPYLAGQDPRYLESALEEWRSGQRNTDPSLQMVMVATRMSNADISAIAWWFASLTPAPPTQAAPPAAGRSEPTSPEVGGASTQGRGVSGHDPAGSQQGPGGAPTR